MQRNVRRATRPFGDIDPWLMLAFLALMCIGVLMVYSASIADAVTYYGTPLYVFEREIIWVVLGFIGLTLAVRIHYEHWKRGALLFFGISLVMLLAVLTPHVGHISHGARRWFSIGGGVTIEPSELIKLSLIIYMAVWLTSKGEAVRDFKKCFVPFSMIVGLVALLIVKQPDLGTTIVLTATIFAVYYVAGADLKHMAAVALGSSSIGWFLAHSSYRSNRLLAFTDPWKDPTGVGYHTVQVLLALGSGGITGRGLGNSVQKNVLPAPHTDSILAVIGEEWGLVGTVGVLLLFVIIAYRGTRIALSAPDPFGRLLATGITSWICLQAMMNFAVITSSVPFTGVPLPFISYGGTSLIITMTAMGILLNISRHRTEGVRAHGDNHNGRGNGRTRVPRVIDHPVSGEGGSRGAVPLHGAQPAGRPRTYVHPIGRRPYRPVGGLRSAEPR